MACLVRHIEYSENGGNLEQWMFLEFMLQKCDKDFSFINFLNEQSETCV